MTISFRPLRLIIAVLSVALASFAIAACGGSDDSNGADGDAATAAAISMDDFVTQANQICADTEEAATVRQEAFGSAIGEGDFEAAAAELEELVEEREGAVSEVESLGAPEGEEDKVGEFIDLNRQLLAMGSDLADGVRSQDEQALTAFAEEAGGIQAEIDEIAGEYGLTDCVGGT